MSERNEKEMKLEEYYKKLVSNDHQGLSKTTKDY